MKKFFFLYLLFITSFSLNAQWVRSFLPRNESVQSLFASNTTVLAGVYAGGGIFRSTNNGVNWISVGLSGKTVRVFLASGSDIFAGTIGLYKSIDNGLNWSAQPSMTYSLRALVSSGSNIFAGGSGVFLSTDYGTSWTSIGLTDKNVYALAVLDSNIFAGIAGSPLTGIYKSTNNGVNWSTANYGLTNLDVRAFTVLGANIFVGTYGGGVFKSTNKGISWIAVNNGLTNLIITTLAVSGSNIFIGTGGGLFISTNNGNDWLSKNQGFTPNVIVYSIAFGGNYIYAGANDSSVWRRSYTEIIGVQNISSRVPSAYSLKQNYPNPFNPSTYIEFDVLTESNVLLKVFDVSGREITTLVNEKLNEGSYIAEWNAENYPSGIYFYSMSADNFRQTKKMILIK